MKNLKIEDEILKYKTENVYFYDSYIEIIKNRIIQKRVNYSEIKKIDIEKGFLLKNNLLIIIASLVIIYYTLKLLNYSLKSYQSENMGVYGFLMYFFNRGSIISTWGPVLLSFAGISGIYTSLLRSHIVKIHLENEIKKFRVWEITKSKKINEFESFIKDKTLYKISKKEL